jgi:hypothetical protein
MASRSSHIPINTSGRDLLFFVKDSSAKSNACRMLKIRTPFKILSFNGNIVVRPAAF